MGVFLYFFKMLHKGLVTKSKSDALCVWSKSFGGEAILDKRLAPKNEWLPSVGDWIVFTIKNDSNFVEDFIDIPNILPTRLNEHGGVMASSINSFLHLKDFKNEL